MKLTERIQAELNKGNKNYWDVMRAVFPEDKYPKAFNHSANGGPHGCAMAFGSALSRMGLTWFVDPKGRRSIYKLNNQRSDGDGE
jgi:hypothetical protein